jgi:DNA-binding NtrC family response regulator
MLLVRHIIGKFNGRLKKNITGVAQDALEKLAGHNWPGNIRELENVLERTILFCSTDQIEVSDLPDEFSPTVVESAVARADSTPSKAVAEAGSSIEAGGSASLKDVVRAETSRVERELIAKALDETGGNVTQAAKLLKISRKSLQMKMKEFGLRDREAGA